MGKSKKRYLFIIISAVMVVLCTTAALAEPVTVSTNIGQSWYREGLNGSWEELDLTDEVTLRRSQSPYTFIFPYYFTGNDNSPYFIQPFYTYEGTIRMTFYMVNISYDLINFDGYFCLANGDDPNDPDFDYINLQHNSITFDSVRSYSTNSATNMVTYTYNFTFRTTDDLDYNEYDHLIVYYPLARNHMEESVCEFGFYSTSFTSFEYDITGDAYFDAVSRQLSSLYEGLESIRADMAQHVQDILNSNASIIQKMQQIHDYLSTMLQTEADREDALAQSRANQGQQAAASTFDNSDFLTGLRNLFNGINSTSTSFNFYFPAAHNVPYLGDLWDQKPIPFQEWINNLPGGVLAAARGVFWLGVLLSVFWHFKNLLNMIGGGDKD